MKSLTVDVSNSSYESLLGAVAANRTTLSLLVDAAIANSVPADISWVGMPSYPLRESINHAVNSVSALSIHYNDLGLGIAATGDSVVLIENRFFRMSSEGAPVDMEGGKDVTHAIIVTFDAEHLRNDFAFSDVEELAGHCEQLRAGKNIFYVLRVDGQFRSLTLSSSPNPHVAQHFALRKNSVDPRIVENVEGTLIGVWSSRFTSGICRPGYYFYFVSRERDCSGFVINCSASGLRMLGMPVTSLRLIHQESPRPEPGKESPGASY